MDFIPIFFGEERFPPGRVRGDALPDFRDASFSLSLFVYVNLKGLEDSLPVPHFLLPRLFTVYCLGFGGPRRC